MKILQVVDKEPHDGGVAGHVSDLTADLTRRGEEVSTLHLQDRPTENSGNGDVHVLPFSYGAVAGYRLRPRLQAVLAEARPDVIHVHGCFTTLSPVLSQTLKLSAPLVGTLHDIRPFCYVMTRRFAPTGALCLRRCGSGCFSSGCVQPHSPVDVLRLPRRWLVDGAALNQWSRFDRVIAPSTYMRDLALQHGIPASHLEVIPHGTKITDACHTMLSRMTPPLILFLGGLFAYKGLAVMLDALQRLKGRSWQAMLVGDGPMRAELEQAIVHYGLNAQVSLLGHIRDRSAIDALLSRARLLVMPSVIPESFSLAGLEALAAGTPVVSFGLGGTQEWLRHEENGLIAIDNNATDLARQIQRLLDEPLVAESMGRRGQHLVAQHFGREQAADRIWRVYKEAAQRETVHRSHAS